ncbi:flavin-containing monooxygenase [uncultured Fibrella sp.]|uniref:flavin-containing monooxygenase n=1 Tax=uncultured Fibrella sp. TaxID=1284596 RepID=UPI0035CB2240
MKPDVQVAIIGAGFAGLGTAIRLQMSGRTSFVVYERANDVGGTWRENTYPGCACDVPSHLYSYSFAPNPNWSKAYSPQPEIHRYLQECVGQFGLRDHIRFNTEVVDTRWLESDACWQLTDQRGGILTARVVVAATGPLNRPSVPDLPGLGTFAGTTFHSARWNHEYDLRGKRVAVIGTGASAIQLVPELAKITTQLTVFQRTAPYVTPRRNRDYALWQQRLYALVPTLQKVHRHAIYWFNELFGLSFIGNETINKLGTATARKHLEHQIKDPELRRKVWPNYKLGCKRILVSDEYYPALTRPNVELVTDRIEHVTPVGIRTSSASQDGTDRPFDALIFSTGFVVADIYLNQSIIGRNGRDLLGEWEQTGAQALYGLTVSGFPNLLFLLGPNTGLGHNSVVHMIESQLTYLLDYLRQLEQAGDDVFFDVKPEAQRTHNAQIQQQLAGTVWASGCQSWYMNQQGKNTTLWPDLTVTYRKATRSVNMADYVVERATTSAI